MSNFFLKDETDTNKQYPKISIITPSFNQGQYLEETILSVLNQNYPNFEYIIIDGGSTDNSLNIIKKYANRLTYWVSEPDNGMYHAIQKGFDKSSGEIMAWINSDDKYSDGAFSIVSQIFYDYKDIDWITSNPAHIDELSRIINTRGPRFWDKFDYALGNYKFIQQEGTFWRKTLWEKAGAYISQDYKLASDMELWSRFFNISLLYSVDAILGLFRIRSENQKSLDNYNEYLKEAELIANNYLPLNKKKFILSIHKKATKKLIWRLYFNRYNKLRKKNNLIKIDRKSQKFIVSNS
ncbi:MAG: glycosyltransferase [Bacteroidales bacterium]|nr:glycosyltransferase [Bacteroidales bacterium]